MQQKWNSETENMGKFIWRTRPVANKNTVWDLSPVRLLDKQSSSDSAVIAFPLPSLS